MLVKVKCNCQGNRQSLTSEGTYISLIHCYVTARQPPVLPSPCFSCWTKALLSVRRVGQDASYVFRVTARRDVRNPPPCY